MPRVTSSAILGSLEPGGGAGWGGEVGRWVVVECDFGENDQKWGGRKSVKK